MIKIITNPEKFAAEFNIRYPGAYRSITVQDVKDLVDCGLVYCYGYFSQSKDYETIRRMLQYEQMRDKRSKKEQTNEEQKYPKCKMCGESLPIRVEVKSGRPKAYCDNCEPLRSRERNRKWRRKQRIAS